MPRLLRPHNNMHQPAPEPSDGHIPLFDRHMGAIEPPEHCGRIEILDTRFKIDGTSDRSYAQPDGLGHRLVMPQPNPD